MNRKFVNCDFIEKEIKKEFNQNLLKLSFDKICYSCKNLLKVKRGEDLEL